MTALVGNPLPHISNQSGYPVPLPPNIVRVVARAIKYAWNEISADPATHLVSVTPGAPEEDVYTDAICNMLLQMLDMVHPAVPGFTSETFQTVSRGENISNYNGKQLNKQPDLVIRLANSPLSFTRRLVGIFIESKVVCMSKPIDLYTTKGLSRFIEGHYGWTMQAGMMLAYQKPKHRSISCLEEQLDKEAALSSVAIAGKHLDMRAVYAPITAASSHKRSWQYVGGGSPGDIRIWHMWDLVTPSTP